MESIGDVWAAMIVGDDDLPPAPAQLKGLAFFGAGIFGGPRRTRTCDPLIKSQLLYQLS